VNTIFLIAKKELASFLNTSWGLSIFAIILLLDGLLFNAFALGSAPRYSADVLEDFFYFSSGTTMIAGILLTMRLLAEERQQGTDALLLTAPIQEGHIVVGKFLGALSFLLIITLGTIYMPLLIQINGKVSWGQIAAGYIGLSCLGASTIAIGTFGSTISKNQLSAAITSAAILVLMLLGWLLGKITAPPFDTIFSYLAFFDKHFQPFMSGKINSEAVIFYLSITCLFLLLSVRVIQSRRHY
jgi:ABC-2 type transport system permease protein